MDRDLMLFFITPIGRPDTPIRRNADAAYRLLSSVADEQGWKHERGDERSNSEPIPEDVKRACRAADLCVVDVSELNVNVYYEFGYAEGLGKKIILLLRNDVNPSTLPADILSRKYVSYGIADGAAYQDNVGELASALAQVRCDIESGPQPLPAVYDPVQMLQECCARGEIGNADICLDAIGRTQSQELYTEMCILAASAGSRKAAEALLGSAPDYLRRKDVDLDARLQCLFSVAAAMQHKDLARSYHAVAEQIADQLAQEMQGTSLSLQAEVYARKAMIRYCAYAATRSKAHLDQAVRLMRSHVLPYRSLHINDEMNMAVFLNEYQDEATLREGLTHAQKALQLLDASPDVQPEELADALGIAFILSARTIHPGAQELLRQLRAIDPGQAEKLKAKYLPVN